MPLVQKTLTLAAGATSDNILANTNYEFIDGNVRLRVASAVDTAGTSATADTFLNVSVNNAEYSKDVSVPALVSGQPFGVLNGSYLNNDLSILDEINTENIDNSHLPSSINVIDNEIIGGIDDGQVLFKNRENLSK